MQAERKPIKVGGNLHGHYHQPFFMAKTQSKTTRSTTDSYYSKVHKGPLCLFHN